MELQMNETVNGCRIHGVEPIALIDKVLHTMREEVGPYRTWYNFNDTYYSLTQIFTVLRNCIKEMAHTGDCAGR